MSENRELNYHGHDENDEESDIIYTPGLHEEDDDSIDDSSDIKKALHKPRKIKRSTVEHSNCEMLLRDPFYMSTTYDRPVDTKVEDIYARSGPCVITPEDKPGRRFPKTRACVEAGIGRASAEHSVFETELKGPSASACAEASVVGVEAMARAELLSASAKAGPIGVKVGVGVDTGVSAGADGFEAKILGTGISVGSKTSISVLGSEVSCSVM